MKLSRMKLIWQGGLHITIRCLRSQEVHRMASTIIWRGLSSAVSAAGQEQCILDSCSIGPNCGEPRVIIVGAGMAGLSAAHRLTQCGIRNFVVLEAKERFVYCGRYHRFAHHLSDYYYYKSLICIVHLQTWRTYSFLLARRCSD